MYDVSREEDEMKLTLFPSLLLFNLSQNYTPSSSSNGVFGQVTIPKTGNLKQSTKIGGHDQYFTSFKILTRNKIAINMKFTNPEVLLKNQNWLKVYQKKIRAHGRM